METSDLLRATVADFFEVDPGQIGPAFPLAGRLGQGSIARAALDSAIRRRLGLKSKAVYSATTYGELESALLPGESGLAGQIAPAPAEQPSAPATPGVSTDGRAGAIPAQASGGLVSCGVDIELVANLPVATDYWEHEFYSTFFTPKEIAYCLLQEEPRLHFAGRWCVKEALKKCDPELFSEEMKNIELVSQESGGPFLSRLVAGEARRLPHAVSMSHTKEAAIAVVVKLSAQAPSGPAIQAAEAPPPAPAAASAPATDGAAALRGPLAFIGLLSLVALGLSLLALWKTFHP
jgi:phosphopantetheine--protein transferase-like protein